MGLLGNYRKQKRTVKRAITKTVNKVGGAGIKYVKNRYGFGKNKAINTGAIAKDVARLAMMINAEKKIHTISATNQLSSQAVGQCSVNATGSRIYDITPLLTQGNQAINERNGDSVKFVSAYMQFCVSQQTSTAITNKCSIEVWYYNGGAPISETDALNALYQPTVFSSVIDFQSARNIDRLGDFRIIRKMVVSVQGEQVSGNNSVRYVNMPIKFNGGKGHHVRYTGSTITNNPLVDIVNGRSQIFLVYRAESGNRNLSTASTLNIPIQAVATGLIVQASYSMYYYDN